MEIYGTIGPSCEGIDVLVKMFRAGMTGMRLNASHTSLKDSEKWIENIRRAAEFVKITPQLLLDLQGPELRIGKLSSVMENHMLAEGETVLLTTWNGGDGILIPPQIVGLLQMGQELLLDDGKILLRVKEVCFSGCICQVLRGGRLKSQKSIMLPGNSVDMPTLTKEDRENIKMAKACGVTGVMLPFVRGKCDLENLRQELKNADAEHIRIYAKIENLAGMNALDEIIKNSDMVVIARGDLGNSMPLWKLPKAQKQIAKLCKENNREFMVVTQMLASMEHSKVPTRAEVSDIYNAVLDGAAAVMLTGETAAGEYPVEAMEYLVNTVKEVKLL